MHRVRRLCRQQNKVQEERPASGSAGGYLPIWGGIGGAGS